MLEFNHSNPDLNKSLASRITGDVLSHLQNIPLLSGTLITSILIEGVNQ